MWYSVCNIFSGVWWLIIHPLVSLSIIVGSIIVIYIVLEIIDYINNKAWEKELKARRKNAADSYKWGCEKRSMYCNSCHRSIIPKPVNNVWVYHCHNCGKTWKTKW